MEEGQGGERARLPAGAVALEALCSVSATVFAALLLWTIPGFLGLTASLGEASAMALALALSYLTLGAWRGGLAWRLPPAAVCTAAVVITIAAASLSRGIAPVGALAMWARGSVPVLVGPANWLAGGVAGVVVGMGVAWAARARRPFIAVASGLALLTLEWEFVDGSVTPLFWALAATGLVWMAAAHACRIARDAPDDGDNRLGIPLVAAIGAGVAVLFFLVLVPRNGSPANLGALGRWINRLPVIGTLEQSTREGSLGTPATGGSGTAAGNGPGGTRAAGGQDGFGISQVGFGTGASTLGGPAKPGKGIALNVWVAPHPGLPGVLYLRGAVYDTYDGAGWTRSPVAASVDQYWPDQSAGPLALSFMSGQALPPPFSDVNLRVTPAGVLGTNLFAPLTPLRVATTRTSWDSVGDAWEPAPVSGTYAVTAAVVPTSVYLGKGLARYTLPDGATVSPEQAAVAPTGVLKGGTTRTKTVQDMGGAVFPTDLALPTQLPIDIQDLALQWTAPVRGHALLEALAIQHHLQTAYPYTLDAPAPPEGKHAEDFVQFFLFQAKRGYCTYFSTAMAVMLRTIGIPSRWVEGFQVPVPSAGGEIAVRDAWAHAWVEAYIPPYGWLTFDPTPVGSSVSPPATVPQTTTAARTQGKPWWVAWLAAGLAGGTALAWGLGNLWVERRAWKDPEHGPAILWRTCERVGARWGRRRERQETAAEYAEALATSFPPLAAAARALASEYGRLCFGPPDPAARADGFDRLRADWEQMQREWRRFGRVAYALRRWL